jgi:hypothetical protein
MPQSDEKTRLFGKVANVLEKPKFPRTYEYARLRFLAETITLPQGSFKNLGRRLLQHNLRDWDVKYSMVSVLTAGLVPPEKQEALGYTRDLARLDPGRSKLVIDPLIGGIYWRSWLGTKS